MLAVVRGQICFMFVAYTTRWLASVFAPP